MLFRSVPGGRVMKAWILALLVPLALAHETLTTTVLFDREIVRILDKHCVMCHVQGGPSFPLETYEQAWVAGRKMRASAIARHMPPWAAVPGYGQFSNDNNLTLRESQFLVSWVEGLGPRNGGTVFTNIVDPDAPRKKDIQANADFGHWQLGEPSYKIDITSPLPQAARVTRIAVATGLTSPRQIAAIEYMPGNRRALHAAFFYVQETNQWIGSWTPWYGYQSAPKGVASQLPANSHIVAELHYRTSSANDAEKGTLGLKFAGTVSTSTST